MARSKECIFCARKPDSKEHIFSDWILEMLPETSWNVVRRSSNGTFCSRKTSTPDIRAKLVCERNCNNGWMSATLEGPMKNAAADIILKEQSKTLTSAEVRAVSNWAFKTTVLANHMDGGEPFFTKEQRYRFASDQTIPRGVSVWLARRNSGMLSATFRSLKRTTEMQYEIKPHLITPPSSLYDFECYECMVCIGYILLQVVATKWTKRKVSDLHDFPPITQGKFFDDYAIPLWPNNWGSVVWPPPRSVGNDLIDEYWNRFERLDIPDWMRI
jgi:hypothetical protein